MPATTRAQSEVLEAAVKHQLPIQQQFAAQPIYHEIQNQLNNPNFNFDYLMQPDKTAFLAALQNFQNLSLYAAYIKPIGQVSANGFIRQLKYMPGFDVVLKSSMQDDTDSLVYEYLVGQCINHFSSYFPFFSYTYAACQYRDLTWWGRMKEGVPKGDILAEPLLAYVDVMNTSDLTKLIANGCSNNKISCLLTQFIPMAGDLTDFTKQFSVNQVFDPQYIGYLNQITIFFHMTYRMLASLQTFLTHHDLHAGNVAMVKVPDGKAIIVKYYNGGKKILQYKTAYVPVIIDYGRCFVNCSAVQSFNVMKTVCALDATRNGPCANSCGDRTGWGFSTPYNPNNNTFTPTDKNHIYLDYTKKNISHDLRFLKFFSSSFDFSHVANHPLVGLFQRIAPSDSDYGWPEMGSVGDSWIRNVNDALAQLEAIVNLNDFNSGFNNLPDYGMLQINVDLSSPFKFTKA
jgi:hypothetical protein